MSSRLRIDQILQASKGYAWWLQQSAQRTPDAYALIFQKEKITYRELYARAVGFSLVLRSRGVVVGDRVAIFLENSVDFYVAYYGAWQLGAVAVPLNTFLHEREIEHIVRDADLKAVCTSEKQAPLFKDRVSLVITTYGDSKVLSSEIDQFQITGLSNNDCAVLLYTSGTTGFPKGVMLSARALMATATQSIRALVLQDRERVFGALPLFHSFAQNTCVWSSIFMGACVIVLPKIERRALREHLEYRPTIFLGVPALYGLLCLMKDVPLDSVRYFVCGGDALPEKIRMGFELIYGRKLCNGYGLTEAGPTVSVLFEDIVTEITDVGRPLEGVQISIRDDYGKECAREMVGNLWVKGDNLMLGYHKAPQETEKVLVDGWLDTGDLGRLDGRGSLHIVGRHKDLIIHKGLNIYPQELENIVSSHAAVLHVGVVGKTEEGVGEVPIAFVSLRSPLDFKIIEKELYELLNRSVAHYKLPRRIIILDAMPLTALGKVDKKKLRSEYVVRV